MPTSDAPILGKDFDASQIDHNHSLRSCWACENDFLYDKRTFAGRNRVYCSTKCKTRGSYIKKYLRLNNYKNAEVVDYVDNPDKFPPLPVYSHRVKPKVPKIKNHKKRNILWPSEVKRASEEKLSKPRRKYATQDQINQRESLKLAEAQLKKEEREAIKQQHEAVNEATKALGVLPLSEQPDVISGKITRFTETDLTVARSNIMTIVQNNLLMVEKVMSGELTWSPVQASLFSKLLNKVIPDAPRNAAPPEEPDISKMSLQELESMASRLRTIEGTPAKHEEEEIVE